MPRENMSAFVDSIRVLLIPAFSEISGCTERAISSGAVYYVMSHEIKLGLTSTVPVPIFPEPSR